MKLTKSEWQTIIGCLNESWETNENRMRFFDEETPEHDDLLDEQNTINALANKLEAFVKDLPDDTQKQENPKDNQDEM